MAGLVGVLIALLTLAATVPGVSAQNPAPANPLASTYVPPQEPGMSQPAFPVATRPGGSPPGCQQGEAALSTYGETVGSSWYSMANAAQRAMIGIQGAMSSGAGGTVLTDLQILNGDFQRLLVYAQEQDSADYNTVATAGTTDEQQLLKDCGAG